MNAKDFFRRDVSAVFLNNAEFSEFITLNGTKIRAVVEDGESVLQANPAAKENIGLRSAGTLLANIGDHAVTLHFAACDFPKPSAGQRLTLEIAGKRRLLRVVAVTDFGDMRTVEAVEITH
jgi:Ser/Thr protein kinase RdoA (MazF antagonist)